MDLKELEIKINEDLISKSISGRILMDRLSFIDVNSRKSPSYSDHSYAPFYYYLGKYLKPINVLEVSFSLGLLSSSFLTSCKSVEKFIAFRELNTEEYYSPRIGKLNIRSKFKKDFSFYDNFDFNQTFDLILIQEEHPYDKNLFYLELFWNLLSEDGFLVMENIKRHIPNKNAFAAFCEGNNRDYVVFNTAFGTGVIKK